MIGKALNYSRFLLRANKVLGLMKGVDADSDILTPDEIEDSVDRNPNKTCITFEGQAISYSEFDARANRFAHWARAQGFDAGETIALVMENCPDYPAIWFGLSKIGVSTALINCHLEGEGLAHCINVVDAKAIIASGKQSEHVYRILKTLNGMPKLWDFEAKFGQDLEAALQACAASRPDRKHRSHLRGDDTCIYIFTSGTTGLPKAAKLDHARLRRAMRMPKALTGMSAEDVNYVVLPLYHITGGGMAIGGALYTGATTVLKRKFSASEFWQDVHDHNATLFVYIGELCRYLINTPKHPKETSHKLRAGFGNGLRSDVWAEFVDRFNVPTMRELYGSTEGNVSFVNLDGKVGAVGQVPKFLDKKMGCAFVKFDVDKELPIRDTNGFCMKCDDDEVGEAIGRISGSGRESFQGYHDKKATERKILRNVFEAGDQWFRTGDLMRRDSLGYIYFVDRIGDTFRWKGENVATNEVADVLSKFDGIEMANVYGVAVPGSEGRAGMASITLGKDIDYSKLAEHLKSALPAYAIPLFLRIQQNADTTGTFKFRKVDAVKEGFDVEKLQDAIWFLNPKIRTYERLDLKTHQKIQSKRFRF